MFDRVAELEVVMGGHWQSRVKTRGIVGHKNFAGYPGTFEKNTGYGGSKPFFLLFFLYWWLGALL